MCLQIRFLFDSDPHDENSGGYVISKMCLPKWVYGILPHLDRETFARVEPKINYFFQLCEEHPAGFDITDADTIKDFIDLCSLYHLPEFYQTCDCHNPSVTTPNKISIQRFTISYSCVY